MERLNYHHLLYFRTVAREGSLVAAGRVLRLSHPTLSAQVHALEGALGEKLFVRSGRRLVLTGMGRVVLRYAEEIFALGREMVDVLKGRTSGLPARLDVGVSDVVPKLVVRRLLQPALGLPEPVRLVCHEGAAADLLAGLATHTLDIVISDSPVPPGSTVRAFNHLLGETGVSFFATKPLAARYRRRFPSSLDAAPMLLPLENLTLRRSLDQWFDRHGVRPRIVAEFEDSALLKVFGGDGLGIFPAPTVMEGDVTGQYGVRVVGRAPEVRERFYAISAERQLRNPAIVAITEIARHGMFRTGAGQGRRSPRGPRRRAATR